MQVTVFGPTGGTGEQLIRQALDAGHDVIAVARRPDAVGISDPRLAVVRGDLTDPAWDGAPVNGADAVLSALGARAMREPTTIYSAGTAAILAAMRASGVSRFVAVTAAPVVPRDQPFLDRCVIDPVLYRFFGGGYADMLRMEQLVEASDADWTIFRPPRLTDKSAKGSYRTAVDRPLHRGWSLTRADLAAAMLASIGDPAAHRRAIMIAN